MKVEPNEKKKELLKMEDKPIMSDDDKIIIYPFLFYSHSIDNQEVYDLFLKIYNNFDSRKIECTSKEGILAEKILRLNIDIKTGMKKYGGLIDKFIYHNKTEISYTFKACVENEIAIFYKNGEYYYCWITSVETGFGQKEGEAFSISYEIEKVKGKMPDFDLPKLIGYNENNHSIGEL